jgi:hypothetical protein
MDKFAKINKRGRPKKNKEKERIVIDDRDVNIDDRDVNVFINESKDFVDIDKKLQHLGELIMKTRVELNQKIADLAAAVQGLVDSGGISSDFQPEVDKLDTIVSQIQGLTGGTGTQVSPSITGQPQNVNTPVNGSATFTVTATGTPAPTYQWLKNGLPIPGANSASYTTSNLQLVDSASNYSVVVTNASGSVTSSLAVLVVS